MPPHYQVLPVLTQDEVCSAEVRLRGSKDLLAAHLGTLSTIIRQASQRVQMATVKVRLLSGVL